MDREQVVKLINEEASETVRAASQLNSAKDRAMVMMTIWVFRAALIEKLEKKHG